MHLTAAFDSGNIEVVKASDPTDVQLRIAVDHGASFYQWFHFRVSGTRGQPCTFRLLNAAGAAYAQGWPGYRAVASYDRQHWFRVPTAYEDGVLSIHHTPDRDVVWYAYFAPYSQQRHADFVARSVAAGAGLTVLGSSIEGRPIDRLTLGTDGPGQRVVWVVCRQHPGETMAAWWAEGFVDRLLDAADPLARRMLDRAVVHVVPNMNPDGAFRGHLRVNAVGANLNREWAEPTAERSPEVLCVRDAMDATGVDAALDVHGDEVLRHNFVSGSEGVPGFDARLQRLQDAFCAALLAANPDFQVEHGYPIDPPGAANLAMCSNQLTHRFACLAYTLEMPFEDTTDTAVPETGWSPARARALGRSCVDALDAVLDDLR